MGIELDPRYQTEAYEQVKNDFENKNRSCVVMPTGCGKSYIALKMIEDNPDKEILYVSPSLVINVQIREIIEQTYGEDAKRILSRVKFITYNALSKMDTEEFEQLNLDMLVLDELHRAGAPVWGKRVNKLLEKSENAKVLGLTATPVRTDGRNMAEEICGGISYELPLTEAVARGVLPVPEYICAQYIFEEDIQRVENLVEQVEDEEIKKEYKKKIEEARRHLEKADGIDKILEKHIEKNNGKYILFCKDIEDIDTKAEQVEKWFSKVNEQIKISKISSANEEKENEKELLFFRRNSDDELKLALAVNMLNEGYHDEELTGVLMTRPTMSEILFRQQLGRALSRDSRGTPQIFDLVNNIRYFENFRREIKEIIEKGLEGENREQGERRGYSKEILEKFKIVEEQIDFIEEFKKIEENLREYIQGTTYEEMIKWLEEHNYKRPRGAISIDGRQILREEMTEVEKYEVNLYHRWLGCPERRILEEYEGKPIEEVPEEYREKIAKLREYGLGQKEKTAYEEFIEWLDEHNRITPRGSISENGQVLNRDDMTEEELYEIKLYQKWIRCQERKILEEYAGRPIEEVPEEYREKIAKLREYGLGQKVKTAYEEVIEWLENNNKIMPRRTITRNGEIITKRSDMTEEERYEINLRQRWDNCLERKILEEYAGRPIEEVPEEYREKIAKLREYGLGQEEKTLYEEFIEWLEVHNRVGPRATIYKVGNQIKTAKEKTEEEKYETNLYARWRKCDERKILNEYAGRPIEKVPEEYREKIAKLREYGYGLRQEEKTIYEEVIEWLDRNNAKMIRTKIFKNGKSIERDEMTEEELYEVRLYGRWRRCNEKKILDEYAGRPIEEVPEEYREKIAKLREYDLGQEEKTTYEKFIEWLEKNNGTKLRTCIYKDGKTLSRKEMTDEERYETNLSASWSKCPEKKVLDEYAGRPIEEVPKEYREKIAKLREYGLGQKEKKAYEEFIEWLDEHNRISPRSSISKNGQDIKRDDMTEEELYEVKLYQKWIGCPERKILEEYAGQPIEEIPEEYREKIAKLREYGYGLRQEEETLYEELIEWLEENNTKMIRGTITRNGKSIERDAMTEKELYEVRLHDRWRRSDEKKILDEYVGRPIEEVPEEYREKIAKLREYGLGLGKKKVTSQDIGKATFDAPVEECDKAQEALDDLIQTKENNRKRRK